MRDYLVIRKSVPKSFIIFRNEQHLLSSDFGRWVDVNRGAHFNDVTVINGQSEKDRHFWNILMRNRKEADLRTREEMSGCYRSRPKTKVFRKICDYSRNKEEMECERGATKRAY